MPRSKALVVYSGGQDSTTCLFWALKKYGRENVLAVGFAYGQRHAHELDLAAALCEKQHVPFEVMDASIIAGLSRNALTDSSMQIDAADYESKYPNTFVEGRNHLFLSFAAVYAKQRDIRDIITGVCQTDFSGYPDCRDAFIKSLNVTLCLAMDYDFNIITPLMWKDKKETWALADQLGCLDIIKNETLTCYNGIIGDGCGECPACNLRRRGYLAYMEEKQHGSHE